MAECPDLGLLLWLSDFPGESGSKAGQVIMTTRTQRPCSRDDFPISGVKRSASGGQFHRCFGFFKRPIGIWSAGPRSNCLGRLAAFACRPAVIVGLAATFSGCMSGNQGHSGDEAPPPSAIVCGELTWDFGTITADETPVVEHVFRIQNTSDVSVTVDEVSATCGCVIAEGYPKVIAADSIAEFPVRVQTTGQPGPFQKFVEIRLGTSPKSTFRPSIVGLIATSAGIYTVPLSINFGRVHNAEPQRRSLRLMRYDGAPVDVLKVTPLHSTVQLLEISPIDDSHAILELTFELDAEPLRPGAFESKVVVEAEHDRRRHLEIPLHAFVTDSTPGLLDTIIISGLAPDESVTRPLLRPGGQAVAVHHLTYDGPDFLNVELAHGENGEPLVRVQGSSTDSFDTIARGRILLTFGPRRETEEVSLIVLSDRVRPR